jgi:glutamine synthetase
MDSINIQEFNNAFLSSRKAFASQKECLELLRHNKVIDLVETITVCFSNIEGRLHMLDYDKDFLLNSHDNLTFDGSSVRGLTEQFESDLRLKLDWTSVYLLPAIFSNQKDGVRLFIFAEILDKDSSAYSSDIRTLLKEELLELRQNFHCQVNVAAEIEGFLFNGVDAESSYIGKFEYTNSGGYYNSLPRSLLKDYIDDVSSVLNLAGFRMEKTHPEVAPSQFEINWSYTDALIAADQIQMYKLICRQVAHSKGMTACFLPKPIGGVNGSGMHINLSISNEKNGNWFYKEGEQLSDYGMDFVESVLSHANGICLALNPSVNAFRRLDPHYEAPNEIKASAVDRGSMIRIPIGNSKTARIEIRSVAPDANPYLAILSIIKAGMASSSADGDTVSSRADRKFLPDNINSAIDLFGKSDLIKIALGTDVQKKYMQWKQEAADRCPKKLGTTIKPCEILYHHEVTNQHLWNAF